MTGPSRRGAWVLSGSVQVAAAAVSSAASADRIIEDEVRELVRRRGLDPLQEPDAIRRLVDEVINDYEERSLLGALPALGDRADAARAVTDVVAGFGPLQRHLDDPSIEEIWINEPGRVFVARHGRSELTNTILTDTQVRDIVERMLKTTGRRVDLSSPFVDAMLPDGSRLHVVIPDITRRHWSINVRKFVMGATDLDELIGAGELTSHAARFLESAVISGLNVIIAGGTQAGKTTLLNCLASCIPGRERVITCEEVFELKLRVPDWVAMQTRQPNLEGTGEIRLRRLVKEALRMRPDRLIVGEVRQEEALDLLIALNSGLSQLEYDNAANGGRAGRDLLPNQQERSTCPQGENPGGGVPPACTVLPLRSSRGLYGRWDQRLNNFKTQPGWEQLIADVKSGKLDVILAVEEERFTRQPLEKELLAVECVKGGVTWHTVRGGVVDPATADGEFMSALAGALARREVRRKAERQKAANSARRLRGEPILGIRPFGFELNRVEHRADERPQKLQWAYQVLLGGGSLYSILKAWNQRGVKTSRGNRWSYATLQQTLKRPRNAALVEDNGEILEGITAKWKPIVSRDDWQSVCDLLSDPERRISPSREPRWLCAGIAKCSVCGQPLRSASGFRPSGPGFCLPLQQQASSTDGRPATPHNQDR